MKALIVLAMVLTLGIIFLKYSKDMEIKKLLLSLVTFGLIIAFVVVGNLTRSVIPIFIAHISLLIAAWGGLIVYVFKQRYYWWLIFSPVVTIGLFLVLEFLTGSAHELG